MKWFLGIAMLMVIGVLIAGYSWCNETVAAYDFSRLQAAGGVLDENGRAQIAAADPQFWNRREVAWSSVLSRALSRRADTLTEAMIGGVYSLQNKPLVRALVAKELESKFSKAEIAAFYAHAQGWKLSPEPPAQIAQIAEPEVMPAPQVAESQPAMIDPVIQGDETNNHTIATPEPVLLEGKPIRRAELAPVSVARATAVEPTPVSVARAIAVESPRASTAERMRIAYISSFTGQ